MLNLKYALVHQDIDFLEGVTFVHKKEGLCH